MSSFNVVNQETLILVTCSDSKINVSALELIDQFKTQTFTEGVNAVQLSILLNLQR